MMLEALRAGAKSWLAMGLFFLLIGSFAIWGMGDVARGPGMSAPVAEVGKRQISQGEYERAFSDAVARIQSGMDLPREEAAEQAVKLGLWRQILDRLILLNAVEDMAAEMGIDVSQELAAGQIASYPDFQNELGAFDRVRFSEFLSAIQMTPTQFVEIQRGDMRRGLVVDTVVGGFRPPDNLTRTLFIIRSEQRSADYVFVPPVAPDRIDPPDEEQLAAFYEANKGDFRTPEYRSFDYLLLDIDQVIDDVRITEEALRQAYEYRAADFESQEERRVEHIIFFDESTAQTAYEAVVGGESFESVAEDHGGAIPLGMVNREVLTDLGDGAEDAVFALEEGQVSEPVETEFGWHLFHVTEIEQSDIEPFEEIRDELKDQVARSQAADILYDIYLEIIDSLAGGANIQDVAESFELELRHVEKAARNGRLADGGRIDPGDPARVALPRAFEITPQTPLDINEMDDGRYLMVEVSEIQPPRIPPLEEIRDKVAAAWTEAQRDRLSREKAEALAEDAELLGSLARVAQRDGMTLNSIDAFLRDGTGTGDDIPQTMVSRMFRAAPGNYVIAARPDQPGYIVAQVTGAQPGSPSAARDAYRSFDENIASLMSDEMALQLQRAALEEVEWKINVDAVKRALTRLVDDQTRELITLGPDGS